MTFSPPRLELRLPGARSWPVPIAAPSGLPSPLLAGGQGDGTGGDAYLTARPRPTKPSDLRGTAMSATTLDLDALHLDKGVNREAYRRVDGTFGPVPIEARLWGRIVVTESGCWEYQGQRNDNGYGIVYYQDRLQGAHRVAYQLSCEPIPGGLVVMHSCDNPPCVKPAHLSVGTVADNNRDREAKGRTKNLELGRAVLRARAQAVTQCPQGHPYAEENVRYRHSGARYCAECYRERTRSYRAANRALINERRRERRAAQRSA